MAFWLLTSQHLSTPASGQFPVAQCDHSVDHHVSHACGNLIRRKQSTAFREQLRLKNRQVGPRGFANDAPIRQPQTLCRQ